MSLKALKMLIKYKNKHLEGGDEALGSRKDKFIMEKKQEKTRRNNMKKLIGILVMFVAAMSFSFAQAAQIDGMQTNSGPNLPSGLSVYVNPGDLGDALIGGYYNARNAFTFIRLINTSTTDGVAVKVRFREGKFTNEVLDFFVCLSAGDQWTAWVYGDDDPSHPALVTVWDDDTPTFPSFGSLGGTVAMADGSHGANSCVTPDMTKEGYFTIIGVSSWDDVPGASKVVDTSGACGETLGLFDEDGFTAPALGDVPNTLAGAVVIYDLVDGAAAYGYNMLALADFRSNFVTGAGLGMDDPPTLADVQGGLDNLNYILTKSNLVALYDIEDFLSGQSDIIITFPTKRLTLASGTQNPFQGSIASDDCSWLDGCEEVAVKLWNDEEDSPTITQGFSPSRTPDLELCNEVNYITIGGATSNSILNTDLLQFKLGEPGFVIGWVNFDFTQHHAAQRQIALPSSASPEAVAHGLPVIGYELGSFIEGGFGHMLPLRYNSNITGQSAQQ